MPARLSAAEAGRNPLKRRLAAGETVTAAWLELNSPDVAEILVRAGWDVLVIDCEHGTFGLEEGLRLIRAIEAAGGTAIVRVPDGQPTTLKRALDRGARSLIVPMVMDAAEAEAVAAACLYPPRGRRGWAAPIAACSGFGAWEDYTRASADELLLMVQVEHQAAIAEVEAIAAVPGVDMIFIGPNDLAGSVGRLEQLTHPDVAAMLSQIEERAGAAGTMLGTIEGEGRDPAALAALGYTLIVGPNDVSLLFGAAREAAARRDRSLGRG